jgi:hypothetical protein
MQDSDASALRILYHEEETYKRDRQDEVGNLMQILTANDNTEQNSNNEVPDGHEYHNADDGYEFHSTGTRFC